ncbi:MAG: tetratricopeptide repeat protein [Candidatus Moraniibacteriota bacterium]
MLQSIIPPLLVILSVIGIILFLAKKNQQLTKLENDEKLAALRNGSGLVGENKTKITAKVGQIGLVVSEKAVRRMRLLFLKSENKFKLLGEGIRKRRTSKLEEKATAETASKESEKLDGILDRTEKLTPEKKELRERLFLKRKNYQEEPQEKFFRPIISDHVVVPKRRREVKDRLEELLIERIAANPKDIEAYERLGEYYLEIKNLEHAKECFKQILKLSPLNSNVRYKMRKLERMLKG